MKEESVYPFEPMKEGELVAVYGSLRKGLGNHRVLRDSVLLGQDTISGWAMFSLGAYPAINKASEDHKIVIEVYRVQNDAVGVGLDNLESYPMYYDRTKVQTAYGEAWIYFQHGALPEHKRIPSGDWGRFYDSRMNRFI